MPIYEYRCKACGKEYEELVPVHSTETPPCPACSSSLTERRMSVCGSIGSSSSGGSCGSSGFT